MGPDFIDPGHHGQITGRPCANLDGWMLSQKANQEIFAQRAAGADLALVEGVMGLYDGYDGKSEAGSTAQMAKWLGLPVLLAVNAKAMARSAAAVVMGFERFDPELAFGGVVFNHVGSPRHLDYLKQALDGHTAMPVWGGLGKDPEVSVPERHLGLFTSADHFWTKEKIHRLADLVEKGMDTDGLLAALPEVTLPAKVQSKGLPPEKPGVDMGVAMDAAFCFYYPENLALLEQAGARLVRFSPVAGDPLPPDIGGLYLGGGYPELHAGAISQNRAFLDGLKQMSQKNMPIYAECGGFMVLCDSLEDMEQNRFDMAGIFPFACRMNPRLRSLGYREVTTAADTFFGPAGTVMRGHEFHYSGITETPDASGVKTVYSVTPRQGGKPAREGFRASQTLGGYIHLHFASRPQAAAAFVEKCREFAAGPGQK